MNTVKARRGRPRAFDRQEALRAAQQLIWKHGYEAMSLSQLEAAMGIGKTSLYAAFGSKIELLRESADLYLEEASARIGRILNDAPTALIGLGRFFEFCAEDFTNPVKPYGCFLVSAALVSSPENSEAAEFLKDGRRKVGQLIEARLRRGAAEGDIPPDASVPAMAEFLLTVLHGMTIQARDGRSAAELKDIARLAIKVLEAVERP